MILLFIVGKFKANMISERKENLSLQHALKITSMNDTFKEKCFNIDLIYKYFETAFGSELKISQEQLFYALSIIAKDRTPGTLFREYLHINRHILYGPSTSGSPYADKDGNYVEQFQGLISLEITMLGKRLFNIIDTENNIF